MAKSFVSGISSVSIVQGSVEAGYKLATGPFSSWFGEAELESKNFNGFLELEARWGVIPGGGGFLMASVTAEFWGNKSAGNLL